MIETGSASLVFLFPINHCFVFGCVHLLSHSLGLPYFFFPCTIVVILMFSLRISRLSKFNLKTDNREGLGQRPITGSPQIGACMH